MRTPFFSEAIDFAISVQDQPPQIRRGPIAQENPMDRRSFIVGISATLLTPSLAHAAKRQRAYQGAAWVEYDTPERPGTVIISTAERALYHIQGGGEAILYGVAVGKAGFDWAGIAKVGRKVEYPTWTPPKQMIKRKPELARWAGGMPGGIPENPLGSRAIYLFSGGRDTLFRIHGTNAPDSIGTAASSGCIRMLNEEIEELYDSIRIGTKVIVF
jgi:lipoprotein-anchoring transpeptidase ErfK/SrfK